ncbi:hypothetical protein Patl1_11096 [Pistacia atlantica]|uniref:Uncharacterized protein n=1 Tax=Pistacia atlantica TaxID=434234 RepID=A0ACC1A761_9ROSI|nr:hypothetical protein Patl1_11096 [Pistacia atlantica]
MNLSIYFSLLVFLLPLYYFIQLARRTNSKKLPPGSMGLPIIGNSLKFLHAMHTDTMEQWFHERIGQYGPINKLSLFGTPAVFLHGQAANKFVYTCDADTLGPQQPPSFKMICGERNILELNGDDHKRVRGMLMSFLKPEVLKQYVGKMDEEIRKHLEIHWHGKQNIAVMPSMKTLTFNIMSSLLFGIEQGASRDALIKLLRQIIDGSVSLAINLPFTSFRQGLQARAKFRSMILDLIHERRAALKHQTAVPHQDLITCLLSIRNSDNSIILSDEEIVNNVIVLMIAGHDTSSVLITFLVRLLATNPTVYATIVQEQEEITKSKASGEHLTWDDLAKMKYTWRVALETLRMYPPVLGPFKKVLKDFEYEGFTIPQGWQIVLGASLTHMDEEIFPDPSRFDPTRFEKQASIPAYGFVGFGGGPRICPGYEFARLETLSTIHYLAANKFIYTCDGKALANQQPPSIRRICGELNITELSGDDHKRMRGALVSFLKPEVLKQYDQLVEHFHDMMDGMLSIPINLPFTRFHRSLKASEEARKIILHLIHEKRAALKQQIAFPHQDLVTCLLSIKSKDDSIVISDEEIIDNTIIIMIAGYNTSSVLITFLVRLLATDKLVCANIFQEQEEIAKCKASGEVLTWEDLAKMKYTWRVALETLRMNPPLLGAFRKSLTDFEYEGYAPPFGFVAFRGGPRICPGYEFAGIETLTTIHYLVTKFSWKLCCRDNSFTRKPFPVFKQGLQIEIEPKNSTH